MMAMPLQELMTQPRSSRIRKSILLIVAGALTALYLVLAVTFVLRFGSSSLNPIARAFFMSVLVTTVLLYAVTVIQAVAYRERDFAVVPVSLAALFGSFVCAFSLGLYF
jgi:hypothetical protein